MSKPLTMSRRAIQFCTTCRHAPDAKTGPDGRTGGQALIDEMRALLAEKGRSDVVIEEQACLWNCTRHCSVVMRDLDRFSYVTGGFRPERQAAEAILEWFDMHGQSPTGEVPFRQWPDGMRGHFIARMAPERKAP